MTDTRIDEIRQLLPRTMLFDWVRLGSRLVRLLRDERHPEKHNAIVDRLLAEARRSEALREARLQQRPEVGYPPELPITRRKDDIVAAIRGHQVVVIAGETGSGKTTQIPKMCLETGLGIEAKIGCTQPRRVAALSISRRIAEELNSTWGREVGCKIRFDDRSSPDTYIKVMTDGILLAETQGDPLLSEYNALIIDEAHERSLNIDFLLGYLKGLLAKRPDLKLVITSATIDTEAFSRAFDNAPVIEVSGRLYPVEVVYAPLDESSEEAGEMTYIDAAVRGTERVLCEPGEGDLLVFMPGERDIRETSDALKSRFGDFAEIIPLFGRLSSGDQQRVFAPASRRKVVVATNIAETSLTIPGIRFVIDSGLARISRYNSRTRTRRLPIEPISQSSANQRKGRCGRLENGVCIRLYPEGDFVERPPYTQPEIQRSNLAEVILRMKAFRLGEIETFPFINPPAPNAIQAGYALLQELGALDGARELTPLGRDLARLPIDPTLGRMLLQAHHEHATRELLIIASGLSIQDPRERPLEQKAAANAAHNQFADPKSDFLTLLNIWDAVHEKWEQLASQSQRRKFCRANFLSYIRMREWQDLHAQLEGVLEDLGTVWINESNAAYEAIHRSILTGLLGHVARRTERNRYKAAGNRQLTVFPGSALFDRGETRVKSPRVRAAKRQEPPPSTDQPEWIVAGEMVETSQLFARTVAGIDPLWILQLAPHLCKVTHHNPHWSPEAGRVQVQEKTTFNGLELRDRQIAYSQVNPAEATEMFIRSALVEENLFPETNTAKARDEGKMSASQLLASARQGAPKRPTLYRFLEHNRQLRHKLEIWRTRSRGHDLGDMDEALAAFYARHIQDVSSVPELNRLLRERGGPEFLCATEADLAGSEAVAFDREAFPDAVALGGRSVPLSYAYSPGEEEDGVTMKLEFTVAQSISPAILEWAVPGLREAQAAELLRSLPKSIRRELMPLQPKAEQIAREFEPAGRSLKEDLGRFILEHYGIQVPISAWPDDAVPAHLRPRVEILDHSQKTLATGRDLDQMRRRLEAEPVKPKSEPPAWAMLKTQWERFSLSSWTIGDLPEKVESAGDDERVTGWPGLELEDGQVNLRLFPREELARRASLAGIQRLAELALEKDLAWLQKDLRALAGLEPLLGGWLSLEELQRDVFACLRRHVLPKEVFLPLTEVRFRLALHQAKERLPGLATRCIDLLEIILKARFALLQRFGPRQPAAVAKGVLQLNQLSQLGTAPAKGPGQPAFVADELKLLLPRDFLVRTPLELLGHLPRYLKALQTRAERASLNPLKDQERAARVNPYVSAVQRLQASAAKSERARALAGELWFMVEEFKVSVFAQEIGTAIPVSPKRLDQQLERIRAALAGDTPPKA